MTARAARRPFVVLAAAALVAATLALAPGGTPDAHAAGPGSPTVVISQVYGAGGNSGAVLRNDYVELLNRSAAPVDITGWSVQYASATGTGHFSANPIATLAGVLQPGQHYLVQLGSGGANGALLPTPDASATTSAAAGSGKFALVSSSTGLACNGGSTACSPAQLALIVDLVGYGSANFFEGAAAAPTLSATLAGFRSGAAGACTDTDENGADLTTGAPSPRNTASPFSACAGGGPDPDPEPDPSCGDPYTTIPAIQGPGAVVATPGAVTTEGVVVGDYEGASPELRGFYLQDPTGDADPTTSDGIFVFNGANTDLVDLGDRVRVSGTASDFQDQTQISLSTLVFCGTGAVNPVDVSMPFPAPVAGVPYLERFEGMLVRFPQQLFVTEHFQLGRFGQVVVSSGARLAQPTTVAEPGAPAQAQQAANDLNRVIVDDDLQNQNPDPILFGRNGNPLSAANTLRGGDTVTGLRGVLSYTWAGNSASGNAYRVRPVDSLGGGSPAFQPSNPRPAAPPASPGTLRVASFNVLNYFNTFGAGACTLGVGGGPTDCRGAENATEFDRQWPKTVDAILALGADVVGVIEIENDGYGPTSAIADLTGRLNAATAPGTWAFVDTDAATGTVDAAGTDAIKVGFLYRPAAATPVPGATFADADPVHSRAPVAQTFADTNGNRVSVVVNHFKSKRCDPTPAPGSGNEDVGDGQACYNALRVEQAEALRDFVDTTVVPAAANPDVLIIGDLNAYAKEDPVDVLAAAGYTDLVLQYGGPSAYSYVFDGQWGYLDHALASPSLLPQVVAVDELHANADEPSVLDYNTNFKSAGQLVSLYAPDRFRSSDHDPLVVTLDLQTDGTEVPTTSLHGFLVAPFLALGAWAVLLWRRRQTARA